MPYKAKGQCVYKADTGKKVGCTKGPVKKYLAALHANVPDAKHEATMKTPSPSLDKVIKRIAKDVTDFQNYVDIDAPHDVTADTFYNIVMQDIKDQVIKKMWAKMDNRQKRNLYGKVVDYLYEKAKKEDPEYYGDDKMYEGRNLSKIAKKIMESNKDGAIMLNGKEVDVTSIEIDGVDHKDFPDFSDAYISAASYIDGTPVDNNDLERIDAENYGLVNQLAHDQLMQEGWDWRDDPKISREFEKSDVSQDEFERSRGYGRRGGYSSGYSNKPSIKGMTFFNVPADKAQLATSLGLTQTKTGKWGFKHRGDKNLDKAKIDAAEKEFGAGRYWEPKN